MYWLLILPGLIVLGTLCVVAMIVRLMFRYEKDMKSYEEELIINKRTAEYERKQRERRERTGEVNQ